jgi:hypothetical protein
VHTNRLSFDKLCARAHAVCDRYGFGPDPESVRIQKITIDRWLDRLIQSLWGNKMTDTTNTMDAKTERSNRTKANRALHTLTFNRFHDGLALYDIDCILQAHGFTGLEPAIYCGRDLWSHEQVGLRTWITLTWHKMESGRYEIVVYLS